MDRGGSKWQECIPEHKGPVIVTWFEELDDDRTHLLKVPRCGHCMIPVGRDDYATSEEIDAYHRGEQPKQEAVHGL